MDKLTPSVDYLKQVAQEEQAYLQDVSNAYEVARIMQEELNKVIKEKSEKDYMEAKKIIDSSKMSDFDFNANILTPAPNLLPPLPRSKYEMNISSLKEATVRELELKRNEGRYFKGKVIMKPWKMPGPSCAANTLLEDRTGDIVRINCYNVLATEDWKKFEELFKMGREVVILHPFYKKTKDGLVSIRVENRYEFYFADEAPSPDVTFQSLLDKSKVMKDEANQDLKRDINSALEKYQASVTVLLKEIPRFVYDKEDLLLDWRVSADENEKKQAVTHLSIVFSNCSLVHIEKKQPLMAFFYAKFSLWCNEQFFKAKLRIARALIDLLYLHEAQDFLNELKTQKESVPYQEEIKNMLSETGQSIKEYSSPETVVKFLRNEIEWADDRAYLGPMKLFETKNNKGRNFYATRDIPRGEILVLEKGFVHERENPEFTYELLTKLNSRKDLKALFMNLFPNRRYPLHQALKEDHEEKLKEYTIRTHFDMFCKDHPRTWDNFTNSEISELLAKSRYNSYKANGLPGLFPFLCLINHSCDPNTSYWYVKDMVMVIAQRDIKKGEEIYVSYAPLSDNVIQRRANLLNYGFTCDCERCQRIGDWKCKTAKAEGIRCPKCSTEIAYDNNSLRFVCPKGCWEEEYKFFEEIDGKFTEILPYIKEWADNKDIRKLENVLQNVEKQFSEYSLNRGLVLYDLARAYALLKDQKNFSRCFSKIKEMIEFNASFELRMILNGLLVEIVNNFQREPSQEELQPFRNFGLVQEVTKELWERYAKNGNVEWFLPFEDRA